MPIADSIEALGYIRILSSAHDPQLQFAALTAVGVHASQVFTDYTPATGAQRPALTRLLAQIQPGDTLVTWRLDRIGQSPSRLIRLIIDRGVKGVWFTSITEAIDTTPPEGHPQLRMFVALAACEHHLRCEYTAVGLAAARAQGRTGGRPTVRTAKKRAIARHMLAAGKPKAVIATAIGVSRSTLYAHLHDLGTESRESRGRNDPAN